MVTERLSVWLHGTHVADVHRTDGRLRLRYITQRGDISTSMNSLVAEHPHARVTAWIEGLLPDNEQVLQRWARDMQVNPTAFSLLATPIGLDCAGAVQFTPGGQDLPADRESGVEWMAEAGLAQLGDSLYRDRSAWGEGRQTGRFSLAGAQSKVAMRKEGNRYGLPYGDEPTNVIVKPSLPGLTDHVVNEHLCMETARACGLHAASSRVEHFGEYRVFVTRRFDREQRDGRLRRMQQEDLCQALGVPPSSRY